jgi:hypothetical protein
MEHPFNDDSMEYEKSIHGYVLTPQAVLRELGIDLAAAGNIVGSANPSAYISRKLRENSRTVYRYLKENSIDTQLWARVLAKAPSVRDMIKEMLLGQIEYEYSTGYSAIMSGINPTTGAIMDITAIRGRAKIAPIVEELANDEIVPEIGVCLRYIGHLNFLSFPQWLQGDY